jgi:hypothetical protein
MSAVATTNVESISSIIIFSQWLARQNHRSIKNRAHATKPFLVDGTFG